MKLPQQIVDITNGLAAKHADFAQGDDNQRRVLTRMILETVVFATGDPRWGGKKRAGVGDEYQGKDAIAYREDDGTVSVWDWQDGSTKKSHLVAGSEPNYPHLSTSEAAFMPMQPVDHLGIVPAPPQPPPAPAPSPVPQPPPAPSVDAAQLASSVDALTAAVKELTALVKAGVKVRFG